MKFKDMDPSAKFDWAFADLLLEIIVIGPDKSKMYEWTGDRVDAMTCLAERFYGLMQVSLEQKSDAVLILQSVLNKHMQDANVTHKDCDATDPQGRERTGTSS